MKCIVDLYGLSCPKNCLPAGNRPFRSHADTQQHLCHAVTGVEIIIHNERLQSFQFLDLFYLFLCRLQTQIHADHELRSFALFRMNLNGTTHHVNNIL